MICGQWFSRECRQGIVNLFTSPSIFLALGVVTVALVLGGFFAWRHFREVARKQATEEATKIAEETAERKSNEHLQDNLHDIVEHYLPIIASITKDRADDIASSQDDKEEET
ncbi:MAG: DUF3149 domain-containing protein [Rhodobacteraceae bacterium]|nr:DUF3149 domain-containing protein [Paracoccaceae bacterium]